MNKVMTATPQADTANTDIFRSKLKAYKEIMDADIAAYCTQIEKSTLQQYGAHARVATDAFLSILSQGGKRIRGSLTMLGYEMSGGQDSKMIVQAARAIEMVHAYFLIMDDIQDRSLTRRGAPTAHIMLSEYHRKHHLADEPEHFGIAMALNAMGIGSHAAQMIIANLDAPETLRLKALSILNRTAIITAHGQSHDIMNEVIADVSEQDVDRVLEWKTAHYTILNPLHFGMVLAGADCHATDAITDYAMHTGRAFQITDDILGVFGEEFESGKSPLDDIREGKRTLLTVYALEHTGNGNKNFLIQMLGNHSLTQAEFRRCKDILVESGALAHAQTAAEQHVQAALEAIDREQDRWNSDGVQFLRGLATYLLARTS